MHYLHMVQLVNQLLHSHTVEKIWGLGRSSAEIVELSFQLQTPGLRKEKKKNLGLDSIRRKEVMGWYLEVCGVFG